MRVTDPLLSASNAHGTLPEVAKIAGAAVRLHRTDQAYPWHTNEEAEVFVVLNGEVEMPYRKARQEKVVSMQAGEIFYSGEVLVAPSPIPSARLRFW